MAYISAWSGKVYVTEDGNVCVSVFKSLDGEFCYTIGKGQLRNPHDIAIFNNQLFVADYCVYVFMLNGNFVHAPGTHGSGIGQLSNPWSITTNLMALCW